MTDSAIAISHLHKRFAGQSRDVIFDVSLTLPAGACLSLLGPSGCGKTTLLRLLMGLEQPSAGELRIDPAIAGHMAYGFQEPRLIPWRTTLENVLLPLELTRQVTGENRDYATELLAKLGLSEARARFPHELSGGMQMRTALARALITRPRLLLLDEPFAALDERTRFRLQDLLLELKQSLALQYVFVTHSISEGIYLGDHLLLLDNRGRRQYFQHIDIGPREQNVKLSPAFNAIAQTIEQKFAALEHAA